MPPFRRHYISWWLPVAFRRLPPARHGARSRRPSSRSRPGSPPDSPSRSRFPTRGFEGWVGLLASSGPRCTVAKSSGFLRSAKQRPLGFALVFRATEGRSWCDLASVKSPHWGIHLTGVRDLPPRAARRRSLQAGRMSALSRRLWRNSLWALAHNEVLVTNWSMRDSKLQDPVEQHPSAT